MIADEVIPGTDITDMVEGVSGNKNLRNVKFVLCSSKQHRNYLDFVFSTIGDTVSYTHLLDVINDIKGKYGSTVEEVFKYLEDSRKEYERLSEYCLLYTSI